MRKFLSDKLYSCDFVVIFQWKPDELNENTEFVMGVKANKYVAQLYINIKIQGTIEEPVLLNDV